MTKTIYRKSLAEAVWQSFFIILLSLAAGLTVNMIRTDAIPVIGDWSAEGRLVTGSGDTLIIPLPDAIRHFNQETAIFIDARDMHEFESGHIKGARNLPWHDVDERFMDVVSDIQPTDRIITYCDGESCNLSHDLALFLLDMGFENVNVLVNGWGLWIENEQPVEKG